MPAKDKNVIYKFYDVEQGEAAVEGIYLGHGVCVPPEIYKIMTTNPRYKRIKKEDEDGKNRDDYQIN